MPHVSVNNHTTIKKPEKPHVDSHSPKYWSCVRSRKTEGIIPVNKLSSVQVLATFLSRLFVCLIVPFSSPSTSRIMHLLRSSWLSFVNDPIWMGIVPLISFSSACVGEHSYNRRRNFVQLEFSKTMSGWQNQSHSHNPKNSSCERTPSCVGTVPVNWFWSVSVIHNSGNISRKK